MASFIQKHFPKLARSSLYKFVRPYWVSFKYSIENKKWRKQVKDVTQLLFDEESKTTYIKIMKFRKTGRFVDYPKSYPTYTQYFINDFFTYGKNEVLIDCGAFQGDSIENFLKLPNMEYKKIIAFEPDKENFRILNNKYGEDSRFLLLNAGAWNKDGKLYFSGSEGNEAGGSISENSTGKADEIEIQVRSIDTLCLKEKVTFIKMDIEGAELNALNGAEQTILRDLPRLAICIYHSDEDMVRIPEYIHKLVPEYKLYVRHHYNFPSVWETVVYAQI